LLQATRHGHAGSPLAFSRLVLPEALALRLALPVLGLLLAAAEVGFRRGRRRAPLVDEVERSQIAVIEAALLGLLGLLLGFSFSLAGQRFELRKVLVVEEANAIDTSYLRARLLPDEDRRALEDDLRRYVDVRIAYYDATPARARAFAHEAGELQLRIWTRATDNAKRSPRAVTIGLLLQSLDEAFDAEAKRYDAMAPHIPSSVPVVLIIVAVLGLGVVGYASGLGGQRNGVLCAMLALSFASVLFVVLDIDRPQRGLVRESQASMLRLRATLAAER
jgi:hypothetical protein